MWTAKNYRRAAEKHYKSCNFILTTIDNAKTDIKPELISNIFYLSGYILECIFKYFYLESTHRGYKTHTMEELEELGLKTHNLQKLWDLVCDQGKLKKKDFNWMLISNKWNESVRYETNNNDFKNISLVIEHFEKTVKPIYNKIKDEY